MVRGLFSQFEIICFSFLRKHSVLGNWVPESQSPKHHINVFKKAKIGMFEPLYLRIYYVKSKKVVKRIN